LGSGTVERWLGRLAESTRAVHLCSFREWLDWLRVNDPELGGLGPDGLVRFQRERGGYRILDSLQRWILGKRGRASYKRRLYSVVRSFFAHNRAPLPDDPSFIIRGDFPKVAGSLTVEEFRRILMSCNPCYRAAFLCMFQGGMGAGELVYWSNHGYRSLKRQLERDAHPIRVDLPGRKRMRNERPYYTLIGRDAIDAIRTYLETRPEDAEAIFVTKFHKPITIHSLKLYWRRHLRQLGLLKDGEGAGRGVRYGRNLHEIRDLFRTRWEKSPAKASIAEFILGHIIDPMEYNKIYRHLDYATEQYLLAEPWLNILSEEPEKVSIYEFNKARRDLQEARKILKDLEWLLGDPEDCSQLFKNTG